MSSRVRDWHHCSFVTLQYVIFNDKYADNIAPFQELVTYVLTVPGILHSNADFERISRQMSTETQRNYAQSLRLNKIG